MGQGLSKLASRRNALFAAGGLLLLAHPKTRDVSRSAAWFLALLAATLLVFAYLFMDAAKQFEISEDDKRRKLNRIATKMVEVVKEEEKRVSESAKKEEKKPTSAKSHKMITTQKLLKVLIDTDTETLVTKIGVDVDKSRFNDALKLLVKTIKHDISDTIRKTKLSRESKPDEQGNPIPESFQTGKMLKDLLEVCKRVREHFKGFPQIMDAVQEDNSMKSLLSDVRREQRWKLIKLLPYIQQVWKLYLGNFALRVFSSILPAIKLHYMGEIAKYATEPNGWSKIKDAVSAIAVLSLVSQVMRMAQSYLNTSMRCASMAVIRRDLYAAILAQDMVYFDQNRIEEIRRTIYMPNAVLGMMIHTPLTLFSITSRIIAQMSLLWTKSPKLALLSVASLPISVPMAMYSWSHMHWMWKRSYRRYREGYNITEVLSNIRTVRAFGREQTEIREYDLMQKASAAIQFETNAMQEAISLVNSSVRQGIDISFLCFAGYLVQSKESGLRPEDMVILVDSAKSLSSSLAGLFTTMKNLSESLPKAEQLVNILSSTPSIETRPQLRSSILDTKATESEAGLVNGFYRPKRISGTIEFKNVSFQYPTRQDVEVLRGLSFSVKKGQVVALVGPSGSGKSSVFRILQRFYPIQKGSIYLDGRKLDEYHPSVLRHRIGIVSQEPVLFNRTIRENLIYGCTDETPSDEEIISALKKANAWGFVSKLPDRLRTEVGHRGTKLSGGQKQRIAIARALLTKPSMLLLDEATSALDTEAEKKVQQALDKMIKEVGGTTLVIAHRLSTIRNADKIIVLKDGRNMEEGSHGQLVKKKGIYASLVQHQQTEEKGLTAPGTPGPRPPSDEERDRDNPIELMSSTRARPGSENDVPGLIRHYSSPY
ncbi:hypothetical protein AAMO2058_001188000 [Amorphochlora amoebiformis]